jgi:hypothetical protein
MLRRSSHWGVNLGYQDRSKAWELLFSAHQLCICVVIEFWSTCCRLWGLVSTLIARLPAALKRW